MSIFYVGGFWEVVVFPLKQNQYNQIFHKLNNEPIPILYEASQMVTHIDDNTVLQEQQKLFLVDGFARRIFLRNNRELWDGSESYHLLMDHLVGESMNLLQMK